MFFTSWLLQHFGGASSESELLTLENFSHTCWVLRVQWNNHPVKHISFASPALSRTLYNLVTFYWNPSLWTVSLTCSGAGEARTMTWPTGWELRNSSFQDIQQTLPGVEIIIVVVCHMTWALLLLNIPRYKMLKHAKDKANPERFKYLYSGAKRMGKDGYNSLKYKKVKLELRPLYTWVLVDLPRLKA